MNKRDNIFCVYAGFSFLADAQLNIDSKRLK